MNWFFVNFLYIFQINYLSKITKNKSVSALHFNKKTTKSGYDERYDKTTNCTTLIDFKSQYSKTLSLFYLLKILQNTNISDNNKIDFIKMNYEVNNLILNNRITHPNIYSGGLLNDWDFEF